MRKFIFCWAAFMLVSLLSASAFAGKHPVCDDFKGKKRLYGLCNAYQNALAHEDEEAMADISRNWDKWVDENGLPELPNRVVDVAEEEPVSCPCWSYAVIEEAIRCDGFYEIGSWTDPSGELKTGEDGLLLVDPSGTFVIQMFAGLTVATDTSENPDLRECRILAPADYTVNPVMAIEGVYEDQCRLDILDLTYEARQPGDCTSASP